MVRVLAESPWSIAGRSLKLIRWRKNFQPEMTSASMWIRLDGPPQEFWDEDSLTEIAANAKFGKPLKIDTCTTRRVARVCVELDLAKPLKQGTNIGLVGFFSLWHMRIFRIFVFGVGV